MASSDDMDYADFVDAATELVAGMTDRLSEHRRELLSGETRHGIQEPRYFMEDLVATLTDDRIPLTRAEFTTVVRLMRHRRMDLEPVNHFNVVGGPEEG